MPPVSKRRSPVKRTKATSNNGSSSLSFASTAGSGNFGKAAEAIAEGIRARAAQFSKKIPPGVHVGQGSATHATVYASIEPGYAIETGARHPLFARGPKGSGGGWDHWYPTKQILFMEEGAAAALDKAAEDYGYGEIDDWLKQVDW